MTITITASHLTYLLLCHRKLWIHHQGLRMEDNSAAVAVGQLIGKTTYPRRHKEYRELNLGNLKIDHYNPRTNTVHEIKKSQKLEHAHIAQVKYYIYTLEQRGITGATGLLEYPKQRKTMTITLSPTDRTEIKNWEKEIERITNLSECPSLIEKGYCRNCAYRDFCFV